MGFWLRFAQTRAAPAPTWATPRSSCEAQFDSFSSRVRGRHQPVTRRALTYIEVAGDRLPGERRVVEMNVDRVGGDGRTDNAAGRRRRAAAGCWSSSVMVTVELLESTVLGLAFPENVSVSPPRSAPVTLSEWKLASPAEGALVRAQTPRMNSIFRRGCRSFHRQAQDGRRQGGTRSIGEHETGRGEIRRAACSDLIQADAGRFRGVDHMGGLHVKR